MTSAFAIGYCRQCGAVFESNAFGFVDVRNMTFTTVSVSCPNGHKAKLLDGTFDFVGEGVQLIQGPPFTREVLNALVGMVASAGTTRQLRKSQKRPRKFTLT